MSFRICFVWMLLSIVLWAKSYALLVTIGDYLHAPNLHGAKEDIKVYRKIVKRLNIDEIVVLCDDHATSQNILQMLSNITGKIQKNDKFYFFFSGHGSSLYDPVYSAKFQLAGLTEAMKDSGVLLPYDFNPKDISGTVLIGKRDIRPYLEKVDRLVSKGIVVVDACYSEQSIRAQNSRKINRTPNLLTTSQGYPYNNLIYIASSISESQSGLFSPILESCLDREVKVSNLKRCMNKKIAKSFQIPVVLTNE